MEPLRQRMLLRVLGDYQKFLEKRPGNPRARQQMAKAKRQLGELYGQLGRMDEARSAVKQAVDEYEGLLREAPADRELRFGLAHARYALADVQVQSADPEEGKKEVDRAIELLIGLRTEEAKNAEPLHLLARSYDLRATANGQMGDPEAGLDDIKQIPEMLLDPTHQTTTAGPGHIHGRISAFGDVTGTLDDLWPYEHMLARTFTNQGILLNVLGRDAEGAWVLHHAVSYYHLFLERTLRPPGQFRHGLAIALLYSGHVHVDLGRPMRAEPALREALERMRQLVRDDPHFLEYKATHLLAATFLAEDLLQRGQTAAAAELLREPETQAEEVLGGRSKGRHHRAIRQFAPCAGLPRMRARKLPESPWKLPESPGNVGDGTQQSTY